MTLPQQVPGRPFYGRPFPYRTKDADEKHDNDKDNEHDWGAT